MAWPCNEIYNPSIELRLKWWSFQRWHFDSSRIVPKLIVVWISLPRSSHYALCPFFWLNRCAATLVGAKPLRVFITNNFELGSILSPFIKPSKQKKRVVPIQRINRICIDMWQDIRLIFMLVKKVDEIRPRPGFWMSLPRFPMFLHPARIPLMMGRRSNGGMCTCFLLFLTQKS